MRNPDHDRPDRIPTLLIDALHRLEESETRLSLALESSDQAVWDWDMETDQVTLYGQMMTRLGYSEEMRESANGWLAFVHPADRDHVIALQRDFREGRIAVLECESRGRCADGSYRWFLDTGRIVNRDAAGRPLRAIGIFQDINDRKLEQESRRRETERMALAVKAGGIGIYEVDLEGGDINLDARMAALLGIPASFTGLEAVAGRLHPYDRQPFRDSIASLRAGEETTIDIEYRVVAPEGGTRYLRFLGRASRFSEEDPLLLIGIAWDVTEARELQQKLSYQATHDALTGLLNRFEFEQRLHEAYRIARIDNRQHAICYIDLDRFKLINDTAGHAAGDALLQELAKLIEQQLRKSDALARIGGDEFGVLLSSCSVAQASAMAGKLVEALENFCFHWMGRVYRVGACIGISSLSRDSSGIAEVMCQADIACYAAKRAGRNRISVYQSESSEAGIQHSQLRIAARINEALDAGRFCLFAQPIVATKPRLAEKPHYELLVRMLDNQGEPVPPASFIPAAEDYGMMDLIDRWVMREALERLGPRLAAVPGMTISLNLSAHSLNDAGFLPFIEALIANSPLSPEQIHFEITETAAVTHMEQAVNMIDRLHQRGCSIALDDFGSGLSSFNYLRQFPVDYVKIDGSFIRKLRNSRIDRTIVESIHRIARQSGARTIAEFVEDLELKAIVQKIGIDYVQGYGIGRPESLEAVLKRLLPIDD